MKLFLNTLLLLCFSIPPAFADYSFNHANIGYSKIKDKSLDETLDARGIHFGFQKELSSQYFITVITEGVGYEETTVSNLFLDAYFETFAMSFGRYARNDNGIIFLHTGVVHGKSEVTIETQELSDSDSGLFVTGGAIFPIRELMEILAEYTITDLYDNTQASSSIGISKHITLRSALQISYARGDDLDSYKLSMRFNY